MNSPDDLKYSKDHEWIKVEGDIVTVGITDHAQQQLGDIVFAELPEEGSEVTVGDPFGVVESVKAVSDIYSPVSGTVIETNTPLIEAPETINQDCYGEGWMVKIKFTDKNDLNNLFTSDEYDSFLDNDL